MDGDVECTTIRVHAPQIDDLCCIVCELDPIEVQDSSAKSRFHWQSMKCRYFIYVVPEIIAAPILGTEGSIFLIMTKDYYMSGVCDSLLKKMNFKFGGVCSLTTEVYRHCISYTIQCKIAPSWNKVGSYYLAGKNFFNNATKAMEFDVLVDDQHVYFKLFSGNTKLRYMQLENLYLSSKQMAEFLADPAGYIDLSKKGSIWVHVLPSMKRGRVLSISKTMPPECPFKDFEQLRRHWKNMYGYFLPKTGDVIYYQIKFPVPQSPSFTYPHFCIVSQPMQMSKDLEDKDKETSIKYFLAAIRKTTPSICGEELKFFKCSGQTTPTPFTTSIQSARVSLPHTATTAGRSDQRDDFVASTKMEFSENCSKDIVANASKSISKFRTIDAYFKVRKENTSKVKTGVEQHDAQQVTTIPNVCPAEDINLSRDDNVDIVALAKENQLGTLTVKQLSDWLKKHAIQHNRRGKKEDLICKIRAHIRNTQILQKFRV